MRTLPYLMIAVGLIASGCGCDSSKKKDIHWTPGPKSDEDAIHFGPGPRAEETSAKTGPKAN
jgi:hypothetical protein